VSESAPTPKPRPAVREWVGATVLAIALVVAPVGVAKPDVGALVAALAAVSLTVFVRTAPPVWAHAPRLAKLGAVVAAWGVLALGFDLMTVAGTPRAVLPTIIAVGVVMCAASGLGRTRLIGLLEDGPLPLFPNHEERSDGR